MNSVFWFNKSHPVLPSSRIRRLAIKLREPPICKRATSFQQIKLIHNVPMGIVFGHLARTSKFAACNRNPKSQYRY